MVAECAFSRPTAREVSLRIGRISRDESDQYFGIQVGKVLRDVAN